MKTKEMQHKRANKHCNKTKNTNSGEYEEKGRAKEEEEGEEKNQLVVKQEQKRQCRQQNSHCKMNVSISVVENAPTLNRYHQNKLALT